MRGTVAKRLRKLNYMDRSLKVRKYGVIRETGQIVCMGDRMWYLRAKKGYRKGGSYAAG